MTRDEALAALRGIRARQVGPAPAGSFSDAESDHYEADTVPLRLIGGDEITDAFDAIEKWYA